MKTKDFYQKVYQEDHPSQYGGGENGMPERTGMLSKGTVEWLEKTGLARKPDAKILEVGCGMAFLSKIHPGWHGAEYSSSAVARVKARDGAGVKIFEEDAQSLSFEDESFDGVFSWAVLEHVPDPDKAFAEIDRVLRKGGFALIAPAWNCRPWTVLRLQDRPYGELGLGEKIQKVLIPLREHMVYRALASLPTRILAEMKMAFTGRSSASRFPLRYVALSPRWDLIEKYGHVADDDAVAKMDLHAGICFFKTRNYEIISHPSFKARFLSRGEPLMVRKARD